MNGLTILYEDEEIFVISKNSGLAVQGGANIKHSIDVDFADEIGQKIFLVHRLDKDTAGLMIVAKNPVAAAKWTKLISGKTVKKEYIAICAGTIEPKKGMICEKIVQHGEEKKAVTNYEVEKEIETECGKLSQIRLLLETGRMHQIRIHLAKNSCPIAGDDQHGNFKLNKQLKKTLGIKKLLLASVKLTVPLQSKNQVFEIPLPEYMCF
ncbi:MAG: RluA family pseudouridine synthase [Spirochaetia bacterium]|nr:RluA family pseudouridine synthase [Spirochaetia bacterium]